MSGVKVGNCAALQLGAWKMASGKVEVQRSTCLISALDAGECLASLSGRFLSLKMASGTY